MSQDPVLLKPDQAESTGSHDDPFPKAPGPGRNSPGRNSPGRNNPGRKGQVPAGKDDPFPGAAGRAGRPGPAERVRPQLLPSTPNYVGDQTQPIPLPQNAGPVAAVPVHRRRKPGVLALAAVAVVAVVGGGIVLVPHLGRGADSSHQSTATGGTGTGSAVDTAVAPTVAAATTAALAVPKKLTIPGGKHWMPWPASGQAMIQVSGLGVIGHSGGTAAVPIASVTKAMTAYVVLRDHPVSAGRSGPTIVVTAAEAAAYPQQKAKGESLVRVAAGEKITERQALEALMLASGDNMAEILARWDAGSVPAFVTEMNATADRLGMTSTHYADSSGLDPNSVSNAKDLLKLAPVAMAQPTFAEVVGESKATIPLNRIRNYNTLVGLDGVTGIKTGSISAAGGCLLFAAHRTVSGHTYTIYGVVLGVPGSSSTILPDVLSASRRLIIATGNRLHKSTLIRAGKTVATMTGTDGTEVAFTVARNLSVSGWAGLTFKVSLPKGLAPGEAPTTLTVRSGTRKFTVPLIAKAASPSSSAPSSSASPTPALG